MVVEALSLAPTTGRTSINNRHSCIVRAELRNGAPLFFFYTADTDAGQADPDVGQAEPVAG